MSGWCLPHPGGEVGHRDVPKACPYRRGMFKTIARGWAATVHLAVGAPLAILTGSLIQAAGVFALITSLMVWSMARPARGGLFAVARLCSQLQCSRFRGLLGVELAPARPDNIAAGWRQVWYHLVVALSIALLGTGLLVSLWAAAVICVLLPVVSRPGSGLLPPSPWAPLVWAGLILLALALAVSAIRLAPTIARLDVRAARSMIESSRAEELALRVQELSHSRAEVVDAADAERRRIERDLHDGAQQRLVSLAMNLGLARTQLSHVDDDARRVIEHAHDEAKQTLAELRELVRGLHPAVLNDRGLDAALSGIAARSPVPARLSVDLSVRPSPTVEAIAYFVVSEALSNVAKHSQASSVEITVTNDSQAMLHIVIRDDGVGGATPSGGTGLRGLAQRVSSVDGSLDVSSPPGGPTVITVELPCES
jgi:signal transduction histidine kinase